jgi:hypothetical protein
MEKRTFELKSREVRVEGDDDAPIITGHAAVFNSEAHNEVIRPGAFTKTLKEGRNVFVLDNHETSRPVASTGNGTANLSEDKIGLACEVAPDMKTSIGRDCAQNIRSGLITGMSFGFEVIQDKVTKRSDGGDYLREIFEVRLFEVSPVTFPWYENTDVTVKALQDAGVDPLQLREALELRDRAQVDGLFAPVWTPRATEGGEDSTNEPGPASHSKAGVARARREREIEILTL